MYDLSIGVALLANGAPNRYAATLRSMQEFEQRVSLAPDQTHLLGEIRKKVQRLAEQYDRLMRLNSSLAQQWPIKISFNPETSVMEVNDGSQGLRLTLNRANPDVPIKIGNSTAVTMYDASNDGISTSDEEKRLRSELEQLVESYYQTAHRIQKLVTDLLFAKGTRRKNPFECKPITMVRNKLIEHPKPELLYSFGYGTSGPIVRPSARGGQREWTDSGLVPNSEAFDKALTNAFDSVGN